MPCSICGTPKVNKSTCPLFIKRPTEQNWKKHFKATRPKKRVVKAKPKKPSVNVNGNTKGFSVVPITHPKPIIPQRSRMRFVNSYYKMFTDMNSGYLYFLNKFRDNKSYKIPCSSFELTKISLKIDDPNFKINLLLDLSKKNEMLQIIKVITDINRKLGTFVCDRIDFFTNADYKVQSLIDMYAVAREKLIRFVINNREYKGGDMDFDTSLSLDSIIREQDRQYVSQQLSSLPKVKTTEIKFKTKTGKIGVN